MVAEAGYCPVSGGSGCACSQHVRGHGRIAEQVAQQIDGDSAVGDDRDRPWLGGQAGEEFLQPGACLPG